MSSLKLMPFFSLLRTAWSNTAWSVVLFLLISFNVHAQEVTINEVMASNATTIADGDGDFSDWIELYNYGTDSIALEGYGLSDNFDEPFKWIFPDVSIAAGEFLLIWASGKDKRPSQGDMSNGLIRDVYEGINGTAIADLVDHPAYPDQPSSSEVVRGLFEAPVNVGDHYGQRMHGWIKAPVTGNYAFWISGDDNCELFLSPTANPDDAVSIARVPGWTNSREWGKYSEQRSAPVMLLEGEYYYIMALMKEHEGGDNLAVGWQMPGGVLERPINGKHLFCPHSELHTSFSISASGEEVLLSHPDGERISHIDPISIPTGMSYGRVPDGSGEWFFFQVPTPGRPNSTEAYSGFLVPPAFSARGGFFSEAFELSLSHPDDGVQIVYTLDGSVPGMENLEGTEYQYRNQYQQYSSNTPGPFLKKSYQSRIYDDDETIRIYDRTPDLNRLSGISTTFDYDPYYFPYARIRKGIVVKAKAVKEGAIPSPVVTKTYFVNSYGRNSYSLPLLSISIQEDELFDYEKGIAVAGKVFDDWRAANPRGSADGGTPANYWLSGIETERPAHLEYFEVEADSASLSQDIGLRLHGGWSRAHPLKSLRLYARNEYGTSTFDYPFFSDLPYDSYKRLVLRNSGNDYFNTYFRDAAIHRIIEHMHFGTMAYQPAIVFIDGEYWGILNIRERQDKHYLARRYGVDPENIDLLEDNASVIEGDASHYNAMLNYMEANTPRIYANFDYIATQMDIQSFTDYQIANIFIGNTDWPGNNIKFWRYKTDAFIPNAPYGHDGRWRWLSFDTDFGFAIYGSVSHNTMQFATSSSGPSWPNPPWSTLVLRKLLENERYRHDFANRFADMLNTAFLPQRMTGIIMDMKQVLEPEMPEHMQRWKNPAGGNMNSWNGQVNAMVNFANQRPNYQRTHLRTYFGSPANINLTVDVNRAGAGYIRVNTIDIKPETPGVGSDPYPWTGTYFHGIPFEVEAVPAEGFVFSHWEGDASGDNAVVKIHPTKNIALKAVFKSYADAGYGLMHYWHFNDLPSGNLEAVFADYSALEGALAMIAYPGEGEGSMDNVDGTVENAWQDTPAGLALRVRNPSNTRRLIIQAPSVDFEDLKCSFAVYRSAQGAREQSFHYSIDSGITWHPLGEPYAIETVSHVRSFDLSAISEVNDQAGLQFRIDFLGEAAGGDSGNNRFDNIRLEGRRISLTSLPPDVSGQDFSLTNHPNPFSDLTTISFFLSPGDQFTGLQIVNAAGRTVKNITDIAATTGHSEIVIRGHSMPAGVYWIRLVTSRGVVVKPMVIMK